MIATVALLIGASTLFFAFVLTMIGITDITSLVSFVLLSNVAQWLLAPHLIGAMYKTKEISESENPTLHGIVARLSQRMNVKAPRIMLANIPIANAFAYGSPLSGNRVAVTSGLLNELQEEEIEAVLGHELGHLKNRDVQTMMFASVLPAVFYYIGYSTMMGAGRQREGGSAAPALIGMASMAIYYVLTLLVLGLSRLREYYADQRSVSVVDDGARKLSEGLAKIVAASSKMKQRRLAPGNLNSFKALFVEDPDSASRDELAISDTRMFRSDQQLVNELLSRKVGTVDHLLELLSTHPNIVKRLQALQKA